MAVDLLDLSPIGLNPLSLEDALRFPERARMVELDEPSKKILKLRRVYRLDLGSVAPPAWIDKLPHLRTIVCSADIKKLPAALLALPRLRYLHLEDTSLETLDGIEKLKSLDTITVGRTPVQAKDGALAAAAARIPGASASSYSLELKRKAAAVPRDKKKLAKLLAADDVPSKANLRKVDLSGLTFEDLFLDQDFAGAKLAGTRWVRCDFDYASFVGADISGATFEKCYFSSFSGPTGNFSKTKATGVTFKGCGGSLTFAGADLRDARFIEMESDVHYDFTKAKAAGLVLDASFCSEKEHAIEARGADLRGARIGFDVTPGRRTTMEKKPTSKFAWKTDHLKGAKTDKTTQIVYAPLPVKGKSAATTGIDERGPVAKALGSIHAPNAALWVLAIDAEDAAAWRGSVNDADPKDDFQRALADDEGPITVGKAKGVIAQITDRGWSHVWQVDGGIALVDASMHLSKPKERDKALGQRVAQWAPKDVQKIGKVTVKSGVLALLLPFRDGVFAAAELKKARREAIEDKELDRILVPLPNGTYDVVVHAFGPNANYEDEVGEYTSCTRIVRS